MEAHTHMARTIPIKTAQPMEYATRLRSLSIISRRFTQPSAMFRCTQRLAGRVMNATINSATKGASAFPINQVGMGRSVAP